MRTKRRTVAMFLFLMFLSTGAIAQRMGLSASVGFSSQSMDDMKYLQQYILDTYPVEGKITSSFPPFTNASVNLTKEWYDYLHFGGGYSFSTTGGKSSYSDHTGSISTDLSVTSHRLGAFLSYTILGGDRIDLTLNGRVDVNLSSVNIESAINILGYINRIYNQYRSIGPSVSAGVDLMYKFSGFAVGVNAGYMVDFPGGLNNVGSDDDLTDPNDRSRVLTANWTGWYAGIKTQIWLGQ